MQSIFSRSKMVPLGLHTDTDTLDEYLDNAWMSISVHATLTSAFYMAEELTERQARCLRVLLFAN